MKICILTQTASDISDYYKSFFKGYDIYFVTFKEQNPNAVDFMPKSSWSEGRNRLWEEVKGKYDYYLFIDDDLIFYKAKHSKSSLLQRISQKRNKADLTKSYEQCGSDVFMAKLKKSIHKYSPEVLTTKSLNNLMTHNFDANALYYKQYVRRAGWFDAQITLFSDYAAKRLLPYDTIVSGWASAQILIYLLSYNIFRSKAISVLDIAVDNTFHTGAYVEDYKSNMDCLDMINRIAEHTNVKIEELFDSKTNHVNLFYGRENIFDTSVTEHQDENYQLIFENSDIRNIGEFMVNNDLSF